MFFPLALTQLTLTEKQLTFSSAYLKTSWSNGNLYIFDMLPHLPSSSTLPAWTNQLFQPFPVSHVFQATTMSSSLLRSPASSLEKRDDIVCPAQP